jgi:hypothetical protein
VSYASKSNAASHFGQDEELIQLIPIFLYFVAMTVNGMYNIANRGYPIITKDVAGEDRDLITKDVA